MWTCFDVKEGTVSAWYYNSIATIFLGTDDNNAARVSVEDCSKLISLLADIRTVLMGYPLQPKIKVPYSEPADDKGG